MVFMKLCNAAYRRKGRMQTRGSARRSDEPPPIRRQSAVRIVRMSPRLRRKVENTGQTVDTNMSFTCTHIQGNALDVYELQARQHTPSTTSNVIQLPASWIDNCRCKFIYEDDEIYDAIDDQTMLSMNATVVGGAATQEANMAPNVVTLINAHSMPF